MLAPTPASPESAGMSKVAFDRIEDHLKQRYIESGRFPGTQLMVYRRGKVVHSTVQGFADVERKMPVKDDTIFRIYSMTKPITSVAFMMLFEEGRVALDDGGRVAIDDGRGGPMTATIAVTPAMMQSTARGGSALRAVY